MPLVDAAREPSTRGTDPRCLNLDGARWQHGEMTAEPDPSREVVDDDPRRDYARAEELDVTVTGPVPEGVQYRGRYIPLKPDADSSYIESTIEQLPISDR